MHLCFFSYAQTVSVGEACSEEGGRSDQGFEHALPRRPLPRRQTLSEGLATPEVPTTAAAAAAATHPRPGVVAAGLDQGGAAATKTGVVDVWLGVDRGAVDEQGGGGRKGEVRRKYEFRAIFIKALE